MPTTEPTTVDGVRIVRETAPDGSAAPQEWFTPVEPRVTVPTPNLVAEVLIPLRPVPTDQPGVYRLGSPEFGSGWARIEGFGAYTLQTVDDLLLMQRVRDEMGEPEPFRNPDFKIMSAFILRSNNPWMAIAVMAALAVIGIVGIAVSAGRGDAAGAVGIGFGGLIAVLATVMIVMSAMRVGWWHRARATALRIAGRLPSHLKGL